MSTSIPWSEAEVESVRTVHKSSKSSMAGFNALAFHIKLLVHYGEVSNISLFETAYAGITEWLTCTPGLFEPWLRCRSICNAILDKELKDSIVYVHLFMDTNLTEADLLALIPHGVKTLNKKVASAGTGVLYIVTAGRLKEDFQFIIPALSVAIPPTNYKILIGAMRKKIGVVFYVSGVSVTERECDEYVMKGLELYSEQNERNVEEQLTLVKIEVRAIVPDITDEQLDDLVLYIEGKLKIEK